MSFIFKTVRLTAFVIIAAVSFTRTTPAAPVTLIEIWTPDALPGLWGVLRTAAVWDDASITGAGEEFVSLNDFTLDRTINGIGDSFDRPIVFDIPTAQAQSLPTFAAFYVNGVFERVTMLNFSSSASFIPLSANMDGKPPNNGNGVRISDSTTRQFVLGFASSGQWSWTSQTVELSVGGPTPALSEIPIPSTAVLFGSGLAAAAYWRRRNQARNGRRLTRSAAAH